MVERDLEIEEDYSRQYDAEHGAQLINAGRVTVDTLLADITRQRTAAAERISLSMYRESELGAFDADSVADMLRHTI